MSLLTFCFLAHYPRTTESSEVKVNEKYTIPKNAWVFLESWAIHRDKHHWGEDAEEFNPERWLDDKKRHVYVVCTALMIFCFFGPSFQT